MTNHYQRAIDAIRAVSGDLSDAADRSDEEFEAMLEGAGHVLVVASVHAALAQVDAIRELTEAVKDLRHAR